MRRISGAILVMGILLAAATALVAADPKDAPPQGMPEMGPPKELTEMEWLIGTWDVDMKSRMDPSTENWESSKSVAVYSKSTGGAAIKADYTGNMMGMPFEGTMLTCYDREMKQWQSVWTDNFSARISIYTGKCDKAGSVLQGEEMWMGQKSLSRISTVNHTPTKFDWKMESSMDGGKTWFVSMSAVYTKRAK